MTPSRDTLGIDGRIAHSVMGWALHPWSFGHAWYDAEMVMVAPLNWSPSTDFAAAWRVVATLYDGGYCFEFLGNPHSPTMTAAFFRGAFSRRYGAQAPALPLAICRAALDAVSHEGVGHVPPRCPVSEESPLTDRGRLSWGPDAECSCVADTTDEAAAAANRLTAALSNGEQFTDEDFATLRDWASDTQWYRANSGNLGPHHDRDCPHWLATYPADEQGAA